MLGCPWCKVEPDMAKKSLLEIYALAVCFAAALVILFNGAMSLNYLVRILNPNLTVSSYEYDRSLTDEAYLRTGEQEGRYRTPTQFQHCAQRHLMRPFAPSNKMDDAV